MGDLRFQSIAVNDARLARLAAGPQPAWLWSTDGSRILWCNNTAAAALRHQRSAALEKPRSPADPHARQVARLAGRLASDGAPRLERLRGFGAKFGQLTTCACSRFETGDGESAILLVAMQLPTRVRAPAPLAATEQANAMPVNDPILNQPVTNQRLAPTPPPDAPMDDADGNSADPLAGTSLTEDVTEADPTEPEHDDEASPVVQLEDHRATVVAEPVRATGKPLRFVWRIDTAGRFSLISDAFLRIAGERTAEVQGRAWNEVARALDLDPQGRVAAAIAGARPGAESCCTGPSAKQE